jgi:hypothetical protein
MNQTPTGSAVIRPQQSESRNPLWERSLKPVNDQRKTPPTINEAYVSQERMVLNSIVIRPLDMDLLVTPLPAAIFADECSVIRVDGNCLAA